MEKLIPINKVGFGKSYSLTATLKEIEEKIGKANVTHLDDPDKVKASWGFKDEKDRELFVWSYKVKECNLETNTHWSLDGNKELLEEVFGKENIDKGF